MARLNFYRLNDGIERARLVNGWFIDRCTPAHSYCGQKYSVFEPGGGPLIERADVPYRIAAYRGGGDTIEEALLQAGVQADNGKD